MAATQIQSKPASLKEITRDILVALGEGEKLDSVTLMLLANKGYLAEALAAAAPMPIDATPYSRKIIYNGPEGEAMIAHWPAGKTCSPHDHGEARGVVTILIGDFYEQAYRVAVGNLKPSGPEHRYSVGDVLPVVPQMIHSMRAESEGITVHLYAPPIREMKVYDQHTVYTVDDNCGAWVPADPKQILAREPIGSNPLHN